MNPTYNNLNNNSVMKKLSGILGLSILFALETSAAGVAEKHEFKAKTAEVNMEVERNKGEVVVHLQSNQFNQFAQVILERSGDNLQNFTACKTIDMTSQKIIDGDYIKNSDRFPLPATQGTYYRIKTISKDGITKTYAPVELTPLH